MFGPKPSARGLLRATLLPEISARLDWRSLDRRPTDFIDVRLRRRYSDLLFSIRTRDTGEEVLVYALVEHQSSADPRMAFRMLGYLVRIWEDHLGSQPGASTLPLIVPVVIYNGRSPWKAARTLRELLQGPADLVEAAAAHTPAFRYRLFDLQHSGADDLLLRLLTVHGQVALWAMRMHGDDTRVIAEVGRMKKLLDRMMKQRDGQAALEALLRYILATHEQLDRKKFQHAVGQAINKRAGEKVVTVYEQLVEEGRVKGRAEGRTELLLEQLAIKFGPLPPAVTARVKQADVTEVTTWAARMLTAATLAETLESPPARKPARRPTKARG